MLGPPDGGIRRVSENLGHFPEEPGVHRHLARHVDETPLEIPGVSVGVEVVTNPFVDLHPGPHEGLAELDAFPVVLPARRPARQVVHAAAEGTARIESVLHPEGFAAILVMPFQVRVNLGESLPVPAQGVEFAFRPSQEDHAPADRVAFEELRLPVRLELAVDEAILVLQTVKMIERFGHGKRVAEVHRPHAGGGGVAHKKILEGAAGGEAWLNRARVRGQFVHLLQRDALGRGFEVESVLGGDHGSAFGVETVQS